MKLLIDAGNTRVKLGWLDANQKREPRVKAIPHADLPAQLAEWLRRLPAPVEAAVGVNVAGAGVGRLVERVVQQTTHIRVQWRQAETQTAGLVNGYTDPGQLGADRWLALVGVWAGRRIHCAEAGDGHPAAAGAEAPPARVLPVAPDNVAPGAVHLLASFGTATTVDAISPEGMFVGGLILPGPQLMLSALAQGTANLPLATGVSTSFPTDTHSAIRSGVAAAQAGAVVRQLLELRHRWPHRKLQLYVTGGGWPVVEAELGRALALSGFTLQTHFVDNAVLDGLAVVAQTIRSPGATKAQE